ncbi:DUF4861 family protein [Sphingomonas sp. Leaf343]|jgi:hypothetical protein|uniref:DUF4861 family protein n=1 Tax=Sphingomonas sp. Leaf343 TaxID=1736345 RepID=UPI0006FDD68A|nr:DUF4861 family protein [Sphingomonas sp. Leaf343]KQR85270.1 glycosyl hydrolase family 88 [Sphingomonas sp. Leaf343]
MWDRHRKTPRSGPFCAIFLALLAAPASLGAQQALAPEMPHRSGSLPEPESRTPRAIVVEAGYRYDDLLWENDVTAHRIYSKPLEAAEPPSGSGIDSWGKNVAWPFADRQLRTKDQHGYQGEGLDFYNVGTTRGAGGLGVWHDNKLWTSRNAARHRILASGEKIADFTVDYDPWPVGVERRISEHRRFTLPLGSHFTRLVSTLSSNKPEPILVGIGVGKRTTGSGAGELTVDRSRGLLSWWGPADGDHGRMAIAIRVDPGMIHDVRQDADNYLILLRVEPGKPFVYYSGSAWDKGQGNMRTRQEWDAFARSQQLDFKPPER